jgi:hypothetical protein
VRAELPAGSPIVKGIARFFTEEGSRAAASVPLEMFEAFVASVLQEATESERSPQAGWLFVGTPEVEIDVRKLCVAEAIDSTPPSVEAEGFGRRADPSVPLEIFEAFVVSVPHEAAARISVQE